MTTCSYNTAQRTNNVMLYSIIDHGFTRLHLLRSVTTFSVSQDISRVAGFTLTYSKASFAQSAHINLFVDTIFLLSKLVDTMIFMLSTLIHYLGSGSNLVRPRNTKKFLTFVLGRWCYGIIFPYSILRSFWTDKRKWLG